MKKSFLSILTLVLLLMSCNTNDDTNIEEEDTTVTEEENTPSMCDFINFKYYQGEEDFLGELAHNYVLVAFDTIRSDTQIQNFIAAENEFDQNYIYTIYDHGDKYKEVPLKLVQSKTCEEITQLISVLEQNAIVSYVHYTMQTDDCTVYIDEPMGDLCVFTYSSVFYVKVFDENDLTDLEDMIAQTNTELIHQNPFTTNWFSLRATKESNGDALAMANYFFESGLFEHSEPNITKYPVE